MPTPAARQAGRLSRAPVQQQPRAKRSGFISGYFYANFAARVKSRRQNALANSTPSVYKSRHTAEDPPRAPAQGSGAVERPASSKGGWA